MRSDFIIVRLLSSISISRGQFVASTSLRFAALIAISVGQPIVIANESSTRFFCLAAGSISKQIQEQSIEIH